MHAPPQSLSDSFPSFTPSVQWLGAPPPPPGPLLLELLPPALEDLAGPS
jgi:hypothetical protein